MASEVAIYQQAKNDEGILNSFIGEEFYDGTVTDEASARAAIVSVFDRIGGNEATELAFDGTRENADGMTVYTFIQVVGGAPVEGTIAKIITDKDGNAIGLVSSIMVDVPTEPQEVPSDEAGTEAEAGAEAGPAIQLQFDFEAYEPAEMSVTLQETDGATKEIVVPVLKDTATGKTYLADAKRRILCAEAGPLMYNDALVPNEVQDGVDPIDAHTYHTFIRVWDFYQSVGWEGPDDAGSATLLLTNFVDSAGEPIENAAYMMKFGEFQIFGFTRVTDYGACADIVAHEYTHCITGATTLGRVSVYDPGAINEGMSDVMGNLVEMMLEGEGGAWTIAEHLGNTYRSLSNPHEYAQPEFVFDTFYAPRPAVPAPLNDKGGVHTNASLLCIVSYKLYQAGMSVREQGYFWTNVALVLGPLTDYPMLAHMLPWLMKQLGNDKYLDALNAAIGEAKYTVTEDPGTIPEGCGIATFDFKDVKDAADAGLVCVSFFTAPQANPHKRADTWPVAGTTVAKANLPAGDYFVVGVVGDADDNIRKYMVLGTNGWKVLKSKAPEVISAEGKPITVEVGKTTKVTRKGYKKLATKMFSEIEQALAG